MKRQRVVRTAAVALVVALCGPVPVSAQSTPLPLPGGPTGAAPPIFTQTPGAPPVPLTESVPLPHPAPSPAAPASAAGSPGSRPETGRPAALQVTSFPELTRGVGNSEALLRE